MCEQDVIIRAPQKRPALALVGGERGHGVGAGLCVQAAYPRHVLLAAGGVAHLWQVERCFTDAWQAYEACLPAAQRQVGKPFMQRLERKHLTLRTRLKSLACKTICFSKEQFFHDGLITVFGVGLL